MLHDIAVIAAAGEPLTPDEIRDLVGEEKIAELKRAGDPNPYFKAFILIHEGEARPVSLEAGRIDLIVPRETIKQMNSRRPGVALVDGPHKIADGEFDKDFSGAIGTEVARTQIERDGKLHEIGIFYAPPQHRERIKKRDAVSVEAVFNLVRTAGRHVADAFRRIHRVTAGTRSEGMIPAFPGAVSAGHLAASNMLLFSAEWTPEKIADELTEEQKKQLTDILKPENVRPMNNTITLQLDESGKPVNPDDVPFSVVQALARRHRANITQIVNLEDGEGIGKEYVQDINGKRVVSYIGGDPEFRKWYLKKIAAATEPLQEELKKLRDEYNSAATILKRERAEAFGAKLKTAIIQKAREKGMNEQTMNLLKFHLDQTPTIPASVSIENFEAVSEKDVEIMQKSIEENLAAVPEEYVKGFVENVAKTVDSEGKEKEKEETKDFEMPPEFRVSRSSSNAIDDVEAL
jgi:hypothetical protein